MVHDVIIPILSFFTRYLIAAFNANREYIVYTVWIPGLKVKSCALSPKEVKNGSLNCEIHERFVFAHLDNLPCSH